MSISGTSISKSYATDGSTKTFAFPFYLYQLDDLLVQLTDSSGTVSTEVRGTDYTISDAADARLGTWPGGVSVVFTSAPAAGGTLTLVRETVETQPTTFVDNDPFPSSTIENGLDKLTAMVQEKLGGFKGVVAGPPTTGAVGDWYINSNFLAGGVFGWCLISVGPPAVWGVFASITL